MRRAKRRLEAEAYSRSKLPQYANAREVLAAPPFQPDRDDQLRLKYDGGEKFLANLPLMDGPRFNELLDELAKHEARATAIREELADVLAAPGLEHGFTRAYVRGRDCESMRNDVAILYLMRRLAYRTAEYWSHAYDLINRGVFGWTWSKLFRNKMKEG
jgi:hypothetical protein